VGILSVSYGGVNIESFISRADLMMHPEYADELLACDAKASAPEEFREDGSIYSIGDKLNLGFKRLFPNPPAPAGKNPAEAAPGFDDSHWQLLHLPASWTLAGHNHAGIFWFRKEVILPENADVTQIWTLSLGAVDKADETYVNGKLVGSTGDAKTFDYWNVPRKYQLPPATLKPGRNVIAVRAASMVSIATDGGLIGPADKMHLSDGKNFTVSLTGNWRLREVADYGTIGMTFMRSLGSGDHNTFHSIYDNAIYPLAPYAMRGAIFYQGEANAICMTHTYEELLQIMMQNWRRLWAQPQFDFIIFQLPEYGYPHAYETYSQWAKIREAQLNASIKCNADLVITTGFGDAWDIHPPRKREVAENAAEMALNRLHGKTSTICRPLAVKRQDDNVKVTFNAPVHPTLNNAEITGFAIAGKDKTVHPAKVTAIDGNTITISSPEVREPAYIWYNWSDSPDVSNQLLDAHNMPVSPFRSAIHPENHIPENAIPADNIPMLR
jgi:sialate O-acetylesterase